MRYCCRLIISLALLMPICYQAAGFDELALISTLTRATAYTLRAADLQIGIRNVLSPMGAHVSYGVSDAFHVGTAPIMLALGYLNAHGKFSFDLGTEERLALGVPLSLYYSIWDEYLYVSAGTVLSMKVHDDATLHGGLTIGMTEMGDISFAPYGVVDYSLDTDIKLVGEVGLVPFSLSGGVLARFWESLDVKAGFGLFPFAVRMGVDWTINLRREE